MDSGELVSEDTEPVKEKTESDAADEEIPAGCILLSIEGFLNGFPVKFLIDSGATDCFVSTAFVEEKKLGLNKRKEKVKINLADGTTRVSKMYVKQACVSFEEHMEFLDFTVIIFLTMKQFWVKVGWTGGILQSTGKKIVCSGKWVKEL